MTHVLIFGDSHTAAMKRGLVSLREQESVPHGFEVDVIGLGGGQHMLDRFFEVSDGRAVMTHPTFAKRLPVVPIPDGAQRGTVYAWCGLFHFAKAWRDRSWIDFRPSAIPGSRMPLTMGLVTETVLHWLRFQLELLEVVRRTGARVLAVETPRPFHHHWALKRIPAEVIAHVDGHLQDLMVRELARRAIEPVRIPRTCLDDLGFMNTEWRNEVETDEHHGNAAFGALMIRRVCEHLAAHPAGEEPRGESY